MRYFNPMSTLFFTTDELSCLLKGSRLDCVSCCPAADEHNPHKELVWSTGGQRAEETHPLHGETGYSCESAALFNFLSSQFSFTDHIPGFYPEASSCFRVNNNNKRDYMLNCFAPASRTNCVQNKAFSCLRFFLQGTLNQKQILRSDFYTIVFIYFWLFCIHIKN